MALIIRKKSNFTFEHYFNDATVPYITNVFNINNGGNETFQLVDYRGANLQAVPINEITLYDDTAGGGAETFTTFAQLNTRLGELNYPPMRGENAIPSDFNLRVQEGEETPIQNVNKIIFSGATVTDNGDGSVTVTISGGVGSQNLQEVYDASDPPIINAEENEGVDTYESLIGVFQEDSGFVSSEQIGSQTEIEGENNFVTGVRRLTSTDSNISTSKSNEVTGINEVANLGSRLGKVVIEESKSTDTQTNTVSLGFEDLDEPTTTQTWDWQIPKDETAGTIKFASRAWVNANASGFSWIVVSSNQTAQNDKFYSVVANATFTDPTPVEGKGYVVFVRNGTATVGSTGYGAGRIIYRFFHSGAWSNRVYVDETIIGSATQTALNLKADLTLTTISFVSDKELTPSTPIAGQGGATWVEIYKKLIPANTIANLTELLFEARALKTGTTSTTSIGLFVNGGSDNFATATNIGVSGTWNAASQRLPIRREYILRGTNISGISTSFTSPTDEQPSTAGGALNTYVDFAFNPAVDNWIYLAIRGSASDSFQKELFELKLTPNLT